MIASVKFKDDYACFAKGHKFEIKPITLLVGDQGCGKSTMLDILKSIARGSKQFTVKHAGKKQTKVMGLDLEKDNPRTSSADPNNSKSMLYGMSVRYQSHGEVLLPILKLIESQSDALILLDEPETSLSLRSQYMMIEVFRKAMERNNQLVLATHNTVFMQAFDGNLLSLEHGRYVTLGEFAVLESEPSDFKYKRDDAIIKKTKCRMGHECKCAGETGWYNNRCEHYVNTRGVTSGRPFEKTAK